MIPVISPRDLLLKIIKFWIGKQRVTRGVYFSPLTNKFSSPPPFEHFFPHQKLFAELEKLNDF